MNVGSKIELGRYLDDKGLQEAVNALAALAPGLCRLHPIGITHEGRDIILMEITNYDVGKPEEKTGFYAEACTHAEEFCGTNAALYLAYRLLNGFDRDNDTRQLLDGTVFYIVPRVNPDGVESVMKTGMPGVSNGRYAEEERQPQPGLVPMDINGDHVVAQMRIRDPDGEWKISDKDGRLMVLRRPYELQGQFYRMYPEGIIRGETAGFPVPMPLDANLNRNYPAHWKPEHMQYGACELPLSEPETAAVASFFITHPNIAGIISFHTNAGAIMRPFGTKGDEHLKGADLAMFQVLGAMGTEELGYEVVSTYGGFTPDKTKVRGGTLSDWTFDYLGIPSFTLELWNVYDAAETKRPAQFHFSARDEAADLAVLRFADREIGDRAYLDWHEMEHPQLGTVEVGGWNRIWVERNPPESYLRDLSDKASSFAVKLAKTLPRLTFGNVCVTQMGEQLYKVSIIIRNAGYLPTYLTAQAQEVGIAEPVRLELAAAEGSFEVECGKNPYDIGHLEGRFGRDSEWSHDRPMWMPTEKKAEWVIRSASESLVLEITATTPRCGVVRRTIDLSGYDRRGGAEIV